MSELNDVILVSVLSSDGIVVLANCFASEPTHFTVVITEERKL